MKLQRTTLGLLAIAALSLGGVYWVQSTSAQRATEQEQQQRLLTFAETDVQTLSIETPEYRLQLVRQPISTDAKALPTVDQWTMTVLKTAPSATANSDSTTPETAASETAASETADPDAVSPGATSPDAAGSDAAGSDAASPDAASSDAASSDATGPEIASDAAVAYVLNALSTLKGDRSLTVPRAQLAEYGLSDPEFVAIVKTQSSASNGQPTTYRLELGKTGFTDDFIYIRIDPEPSHLPQTSAPSTPPIPTSTSAEGGSTAPEATPTADTVTLFLVPKTLEYAVTRPLGEWRSPDPNAPDPNAPDPGVPDFPESNIPESNIPESNIPESNIPESNIPETSTPEPNPTESVSSPTDPPE